MDDSNSAPELRDDDMSLFAVSPILLTKPNDRFGEKQKYRSTVGQRLKLLVPRGREFLEEIIKLKIGGLAAF